jgi:acyl-CoA synthetase (AMP-forming)/AMP-acid ligase II
MVPKMERDLAEHGGRRAHGVRRGRPCPVATMHNGIIAFVASIFGCWYFDMMAPSDLYLAGLRGSRFAYQVL